MAHPLTVIVVVNISHLMQCTVGLKQILDYSANIRIREYSNTILGIQIFVSMSHRCVYKHVVIIHKCQGIWL